MKRILSCFVWSVLLLFMAAQLSCAQPAPSRDEAEKVFQEERPFPMPPPAPCPMGQMKGMPEFRPPLMMHIESLKLNEKQREALKEIENNVSKVLIRKRADEQIAEIELRELLDKDPVDLKAVEAKLKQIETIKTETQLMMIRSVENMKAKLTAGQRQMLKKILPMEHHIKPSPAGKGTHEKKVPQLPPEEKGE